MIVSEQDESADHELFDQEEARNAMSNRQGKVKPGNLERDSYMSLK